MTWSLQGIIRVTLVILKKNLHDHFHVKDLGKLKYFHTLKVAYSKQCIVIYQRKYTLTYLMMQVYLVHELIDFPIETDLELNISKSKLLRDLSRCRGHIGRFIYLTIN